MKKSQTFLLVASLTFFGAVQAEDINPQQIIDNAIKTHQQAKQAGFEWTATQGLIESAQDAVIADKKELAMTLASKALKQAENGLKQAKYADQHWQDYLP